MNKRFLGIFKRE